MYIYILYVNTVEPPNNMWVEVGGFSKVVATFNHVGGSFNLFMATTCDIWIFQSRWDGWGCGVSCGRHHRRRGKTTTGSALDGAVFDIAQILAYLIHNMSRSQLYLGFGHFGWLPFFSVNNILAGLWLNCISSVEITLFLLANILLQHRPLFQC